MDIKNKYNKKVLIVLDKYKKGGMETHTNLLRKEFDADVCYSYENTMENTIKEEKFIKYSVDLSFNYDIIIWQNTFIEIEFSQKKADQKFFYVVHCQCDWWNRKAINMIKKNNDFIDKYIFVSDSVKNKFEKLIFAVDNGIIIENQIESIKNNKDEIRGLFISSGSYHKMKNHHQLIKEFSKLDKSMNNLEIYGDISDKTYYNNLQKYIDDNLLTNIKLFEYNDIYIERLKEAEYFILFSMSEGCSYSILEAMALNKKIICSEECVTCDQIRNYSKKSVVCKNNYEIQHFFLNNFNNKKNISEFVFTKKYRELIF